MANKKKEDLDLLSARDEFLKEEVRKEEKAKRKAVVDQVLRILGLVMASMIFLISFSMFAPLTIFGPIFNGGIDAKDAWRSMDTNDNLFRFGGDSLYAILTGGDPTIAVWLTTGIQVALGTLLAVLISIYVRDVIGVIKNFFGIGKNIIVDTAEGVKEGAEELFSSKKKTLFEAAAESKADKPVVKKSKIEKQLEHIQKEAEKANIELTPSTIAVDSEEVDLDKALTDPNYVAPKAKVDETPRRSLFDKR
jgi:organic radical activating enzyme